jgi:hypothetical protein
MSKYRKAKADCVRGIGTCYSDDGCLRAGATLLPVCPHQEASGTGWLPGGIHRCRPNAWERNVSRLSLVGH